MFEFLKRRRHAAIREQAFPDAYRPFVEKSVHLYSKLNAEDRRELEEDIQVFLHEKSFEGAGGVSITDEIRVTIAAQACVLLLHRDTLVYPDLETILVYPSTYVVKARRRDGMVVIEGPERRLGESWERGLVVLAWDDVQRSVRTFGSGHNVVFHEFAHQLDQEDGGGEGEEDLLPGGEAEEPVRHGGNDAGHVHDGTLRSRAHRARAEQTAILGMGAERVKVARRASAGWPGSRRPVAC